MVPGTAATRMAATRARTAARHVGWAFKNAKDNKHLKKNSPIRPCKVRCNLSDFILN
jgi:hypothetical protein